MKCKVSISVDEATLEKLDSSLEKGVFRNRSHAVEYALKIFLEEDDASR
ncbi:MAG: ribbon-helix-helix domain-containing protein [Candidatus Woesearchaeota archaeon]|jgi:Arc/MetJ-type ribon-helix-helix transcriptional regulator|nr:ribbon-helix-helix domain-containing protein [Candidatus Woesearchaeota archaeon]MDP7181191.1 ribbon-helix-helix domain-containing protein [Candidatus Woesearchaeota archaeon]MDP7198188.1 ribbon-helix-helix domain-containing protein [Candidatus Woesearchaeota archaeon]MDP7467024.1 ribbon-helix-helix domain-containing protein [Candidatus Woesearchaeota archaeon]MDP7646693.1 ribbon-helix-helix domain-containing protein [Candidatus Woesearchaeota archaeon]|tara:strand:+ start:55 stop:201 length:147 start_codon:yes stop_codon:yes gene_type:complete